MPTEATETCVRDVMVFIHGHQHYRQDRQNNGSIAQGEAFTVAPRGTNLLKFIFCPPPKRKEMNFNKLVHCILWDTGRLLVTANSSYGTFKKTWSIGNIGILFMITEGYWTTRGYAITRGLPTRGLDKWTTHGRHRRLCVLCFRFSLDIYWCFLACVLNTNVSHKLA